MTWNLQQFPSSNQSVEVISRALNALDVDIIAVQEIAQAAGFQSLMASLKGYGGYLANESDLNLAFIYRDHYHIDTLYTMTPKNIRAFPRAPLVMEVNIGDVRWVLINNHWKCCGDGVLDSFDPWDEESRRRLASDSLRTFVLKHYPDDPVIILGDFNDRIEEAPKTNVFMSFLVDTNNFRFADQSIAEGEEALWSYPSWPSHLDHILVTNEWFESLDDSSSTTTTLLLDHAFGNGFFEYRNVVSDHRPVAMRVALPNLNTTSVTSSTVSEPPAAYPNPFASEISIALPSASSYHLWVLDAAGSLVANHRILNHISGDWQLKLNSAPSGVYYLYLVTDHVTASHRLIIKK